MCTHYVVTVLELVGGAPGGETAGACRSREGLDDGLGEGLGRLRVLARDELSALRDDDVRRPRVALAVLAALAREALLVRPREGLHGLRLADLVLFDIRETRDLEAGDERRAVRLITRDEPDGTVADRADDLARSVGPFDDRLQRRRRGAVEVDAPV